MTIFGNKSSLEFLRLVLVAIAFAILAGANAQATEEQGVTQHSPAEAADMMKMMQEQMKELLGESRGPRLIMPIMNSTRGRQLFASKGCVTCHSINGIGAEEAPSLDAHSMMPFMNPFDFAARMWRGAATMIELQEEAFGYQIEFTGNELADIIAFVHDDEEQHKFSESDIPADIVPLMNHMHEEAGGGAAAHGEELGHGHGESEGHND